MDANHASTKNRRIFANEQMKECRSTVRTVPTATTASGHRGSLLFTGNFTGNFKTINREALASVELYASTYSGYVLDEMPPEKQLPLLIVIYRL